MPSPAIVNAADLVAPIPGDNPAGVPMDQDFAVEQILDAARKDYEPHPDGKIPKKPEWDKIKTVTVTELAEKSKDLRLATRLTEALVNLNGFAGLRDGLQVIRVLIEECWDRLYPTPDPDLGESMEVRAVLLADTLADPDYGIRFPNTVRGIPLVLVDNNRYSLHDKKLADQNLGPITPGDFERAKPLDGNVSDDLGQALQELAQLNQALVAKLGEQAPNLAKLEDAVKDCQGMLQHVQGGLPQPTRVHDAPDGQQTVPTANGPSNGPKARTREEAYRQLNQIANLLEELEPHSPIPDLLRRCVELGKMPFRRLIKEIVRDRNLLTEVNREFGIKESPTEGAAE